MAAVNPNRRAMMRRKRSETRNGTSSRRRQHRQSAHVYLPRLGFLRLRQDQCYHPVFEFGCDSILVDLARELEAAGIVAHIVLGIHWLKPIIIGEVNSSF
jgi:hypothetical protein